MLSVLTQTNTSAHLYGPNHLFKLLLGVKHGHVGMELDVEVVQDGEGPVVDHVRHDGHLHPLDVELHDHPRG